MTQGLRGFVGQDMSGRRPPVLGYMYVFPAGSSTFTVPANGAGQWRFVLWGGGGLDSAAGNDGGGGGALAIKDVFLGDGQTIAVVVGIVSADSTITLPGGAVVTAGAGSDGAGGTPGAGGTATGGDINVSGDAATVGGNGGSAASYDVYLGGGGGTTGVAGKAPGGGSGGFNGTGNQQMAASGLVLAFRLRS